MFKKLLLLSPVILILVAAIGFGEKTGENGGACPQENEEKGPVAYRKHYNRYYYYDYYWDKDNDATWPTKIEDSFYDSLRH